MFDSFLALLGSYSRQYIMLSISEIQFIAAMLIFSWSLPKRRLFPFRLLLSVGCAMLLMIPAAILRTDMPGIASRFLVTFIQYVSTLPLLLICYDDSLFSLLNTWSGSVAAEEIGTCLYTLLLVLLGLDTSSSISIISGAISPAAADWFAYYAIHGTLYLVIWGILGRRKPPEFDRTSQRNMVALCITSLMVIALLSGITSEHRTESVMLFSASRAYAAAIAMFVLIVRSGIILQGESRAELAAMDQVLTEQRNQYMQMKENIDLVNMRCHDLKHHLDAVADKLTEAEINELRQAMEFYDSSLKTGSEALDVVLYEAQLACREQGIMLNCLADGAALSFMMKRHVYALFSNALRNAMEAVRKLDDPDKRQISLTIRRQGDVVKASMINYYDGLLQFSEDGRLSTTKSDKGRHGYGTMSMQHIIARYNGQLQTETDGELFTLEFILPIPKK